jgi:hypothetical protein
LPTVRHHVIVLRKSKLFELLSRLPGTLSSVRLRDLRRAVESQNALLLGALDRNQAHRRAAGRFTDADYDEAAG